MKANVDRNKILFSTFIISFPLYGLYIPDKTQNTKQSINILVAQISSICFFTPIFEGEQLICNEFFFSRYIKYCSFVTIRQFSLRNNFVNIAVENFLKSLRVQIILLFGVF